MAKRQVEHSDDLWNRTQQYTEANKKWLQGRGWTKTMIARFLGEPDRKRIRKAFRGNARREDRPECVYSMTRVLEVEATAEFRDWKTRIERNREKLEQRRSGDLWAKPVSRWGRPVNRNWGELDGGGVGFTPKEAMHVLAGFSSRDQDIVRLLFSRGMRQREVAKWLQVSQQTVSRVKRVFLSMVPKTICTVESTDKPEQGFVFW